MEIKYKNKPIEWDNEGIMPPQELIEKGFQPGYKPPAEYFNAILNRTAACITELQEKTVEIAGLSSGDDKSAGEKVEGMTFTVDGANVTAKEGAERFNLYSGENANIAVGKCAVAMGYGTIADGNFCVAMGALTIASVGYSTAMGTQTKAIGNTSTAMGTNTTASGIASTAMGNYTTASGNRSIAMGDYTTASGLNSTAMGYNTDASGKASTAMGFCTSANGYASVSMGHFTVANGLNTAIGILNKEPAEADGITSIGDLFIIGNGTSDPNLGARKSNAFRVTAAGDVMGTKSYAASGADYAEMFEWINGNPDNEDRRGLFVTLDGEKIRPANSDDDYILGVVSATPSVVADAQTDDWGKKWKTDVFGERLLDENGAWILNEDFREEENESYISRLDRKEWAAVGLVGKLIVVDDGTCEVNGYCSPANGGIATKSMSGYRVLSRIDENHIKVLIK